jgi:alpha-glucan,water dikinase
VPRVDALALVNRGDGGGGAASLAPPGPPPSPLAALEDAASRDEAVLWHRSFGLGGGWRLLASVREAGGGGSTVTLTPDLPFPATRHWGVRRARTKGDWLPPPDGLLPAGSALAAGGGAGETPLAAPCDDDDCAAAEAATGGADAAPLARATLTVPPSSDVTALVFVLRADDGTRWWRDGGANFTAPVGVAADAAAASPAYETCDFEDELACDIVAAEVDSGAWTLMHRFNRAADLLERDLARAGGDPEAAAATLSTVFIWLRYSAARHLTWQRNYNTQPRLLGAAQDRLSRALAAAHGAWAGREAGDWARAALACVGKGEGAQAVRDEILNIMHRNKVPEKAGTWMEQWHQKLHNNTTPDDVPICEGVCVRERERERAL